MCVLPAASQSASCAFYDPVYGRCRNFVQSAMGDEATNIRYYLRERRHVVEDEASENESDHEEVEEHVSGLEEADEDSDFDSNGRGQHDVDDSADFEETTGSAWRPRSILKGRNKYQWSKNAPETRSRRSWRTYLPSCKNEAQSAETPIKAWSLLFTDEMLDVIVKYTNEEINRKYPNETSRGSVKHFIDLIELKSFFGLLYFSGIQKWNHFLLDEIWSDQFGNKMFKSVMCQRRFEFILTSLRFDDKNTRRNRLTEHKLAPVKEIWDSFVSNCKKYYSPSTNCTIDEQLLSFRGRFHSRVYIPNKPDKYGIKIVMLNDVQTSYMYNAEPYVGKIATSDPIPEYYVKKLSEPLFDSGRNITADNWFMSIPLVKKMQEKNLTMVGTLRKNKPEIPPAFTRFVPSMTSRFAYSNNTTLVSYCPKKN